MSTILYNTNSTLIQKFQRNTLRQNKLQYDNKHSISKISINRIAEDEPFSSKFLKDSPEYLQELCQSCLPLSLHQRIKYLNVSPDLEIMALVSLIYKNFVSTWYGVKIPTNDDQFPTAIYNIVERLILFLRRNPANIESIILDEIPVLLSAHINTMRKISTDSKSPTKVYDEYCKLTLYQEDRYPYVLTKLIQSSLNSESVLQNSFIDALFNQLLLGRILESVSEPYYLLRGISKLCGKILERREKKQNEISLSFISSIAVKLSKLGKLITYMGSINRRVEPGAELPLIDTYIFHTIFVDLLRLEEKKPFLYSIGKLCQNLFANSTLITKILKNTFDNIIASKILNSDVICNLVRLIRGTLFPNDNLMGPRSIIPTGIEFENFKNNTVNEIWQVCNVYRANILLSISKEDIESMIDSICIEKRCNRLLMFRIIDCMLAHLSKESDN